MTTGLSRYSREVVIDRADELLAVFYPLLADVVFDDSITNGTNSVTKVRRRFETVGSLFEKVFGHEG